MALAALTIALAGAGEAGAVTITWTGGAGTNSWHTAGNWDLNRVPAAGDDVVIPDMTPNVNVTYSSGGTSINSLISAEAFSLTGGTLTIASASTLNSAFTFSGTLSGTGDVTVNGAMTWTGTGTMSGTGKTVIAPIASLAISDPFQKSLNRTLENHSPNMTWTPSAGGNLALNNGSLVNMSDGVFTANLGNNSLFSFFGVGGTNAFSNAGTFNKMGTGTLNFTTVVSAPVLFNNSGTTHLIAGGLTISNGGSNTGTIDADAGSTLSIASTLNLDPSSALTGQGTLTFTGGSPNTVACTLSTDRVINLNSTVNFNAPYNMTGTINLGGTLSGSGDITVAGTLNWTGTGTMSGTGRTIIAPTATLLISDSFAKFLSRTLENHSTNAIWTPAVGSSFNFNNGTLINAADGTFTVNLTANNTIFNFAGTGGTNAVVNEGVFNKTGGGILELASVFGFPVPFNNSGTTNLDAGGLRIASGGSNTGTIDADAGTTLTLASTVTLSPTSTLTGHGTLTFTGGFPNTVVGTLSTDRIINILAGTISFNAPYTITGTLNLTGGTLSGSGDITVAGTMNWGANTMAGTGRTIIAPGATLTLSGSSQQFLSRTLENHSANTTWTTAAGSALIFTNGTFINAADGVFTANVSSNIDMFSNGGTNAFLNAGVFDKAGAGTLRFNTFSTGLPFTNTGTVRVSTGVLALLELTNFSGTTLTGGTYALSGTLRFNSANIVTNAASIILDGPASAIQNTAGNSNALANFATNSASSTFQIKNGRNFSRSGTFSNAGELTIGPGDNTFSIDTVTNTGTLTKPGAGTGNVTSATSFTNNGTIDVPSGMLILTPLSNQSGTTLTGGTYIVAGTLRYTNANIGTNAASIVLDGPASAIQDTSGANALGNIFDNAAGGSLQIKNGRNLGLPGTFVNHGQVWIGPGASTVSDTGNYMQSNGATTLDGGTLDPADLADIRAGDLKGNGTILGDVRNSGTCKPGLSPGSLAITGNYTQMSSGILEAEIGGTTPGSEYDSLSVTGTALLAGALRVTLTGGFVPSGGDFFDILTADFVEVKFATIELPVLLSLMGWEFEDSTEVLSLSVIDCGPGDADGDGIGDACETAPDLSWFTIDGGGGTSSGGDFKLSATIGQPDAGAPLVGGIFTLVGGFWPGTQSPNVPECVLIGDMNADGLLNGADISEFVTCVIGGGQDCACADVNESGVADVADTTPLVQLLINQ